MRARVRERQRRPAQRAVLARPGALAAMRRPGAPPPTAAFWQSVEAGRLAYPRCPACATWHGYPRPACTRCLHRPLELTPVSGTGRVYAVTVVHRPLLASFAERVPYAHALVELDEGFRV